MDNTLTQYTTRDLIEELILRTSMPKCISIGLVHGIILGFMIVGVKSIINV